MANEVAFKVAKIQITGPVSGGIEFDGSSEGLRKAIGIFADQCTRTDSHFFDQVYFQVIREDTGQVANAVISTTDGEIFLTVPVLTPEGNDLGKCSAKLLKLFRQQQLVQHGNRGCECAFCQADMSAAIEKLSEEGVFLTKKTASG